MKIEIKKLNKKYYDKTIFHNASLNIDKEGIYVLSGDNGEGKTTLLNILSSFDKEFDGDILINGEPASFNCFSKYISYFNVDFNLFDSLTVKENLELVNTNYKEIISTLNLNYLLNAPIKHLSKGEKARIGIVKTLLQEKDIALFDEPFAYLDEKTAKQYIDLLKDYAKSHIVILISHIYKEIEKDDSTNIIEIKNKCLKLKKSDCSIDLNDIQNKQNKNKKKNHLILSCLKFSFKEKFKLLTAAIMLTISFSFCFVSLNFLFDDKQNTYNQLLDNAQMSYAYTSLDNNLDYLYHGNEIIMKSKDFIRYVDVFYNKDDDNSTIELPIKTFVTTKDYVYLGKKRVDFAYKDNKIPLMVNKGFLYKHNVNLNDDIDLNIFGMYGTENQTGYIQKIINTKNNNAAVAIMSQKGITDHFKSNIFISSDGSLSEQKNTNIDHIFNQFKIKKDDYLVNVIQKDETNSLKDNEISLVFNESYILNKYGNINNFDDFFKENIKRKIIDLSNFNELDISEKTDSDVSNDINIEIQNAKLQSLCKPCNLNNIFNKIEIKDYELKNYKLDYPNDVLGIIISDNNFDKMVAEPLKYSPIVSQNACYFDKETLKSNNVYVNNINYLFHDKGILSEVGDYFFVINAKSNFMAYFIPISILFLLISLFLLLVFNLNSFKQNMKNIYVLKQNGSANNKISFIFSLSSIFIFIISFSLGLLCSYAISIPLNNFFLNYTNAIMIHDYFALSAYSILIILTMGALIASISFVSYYFYLKKKNIKDFISD